MTFVEAAIEVLKREGKPLPARKLAELAMKADLLSVVGRDPEGTMISRIEDALEKHATLIKVKDGVYGLRDYPPQPYPVIAEKPAKAPRAEKAAAEGEAAAGEAAEGAEAEGDAEGDAEGAAGEKKGRRRRGRRGRGKRGDAAAKPNGAPEGEAVEADAAEGDQAGGDEAAEPAAPAPARAKRATAAAKAAAESGAVTEAEAGEAAEGAAVEAAEGIDGEATEGGEKRGRRRSRRGGRGRRREPGTAAGSEAAAGEAAGDGDASEPPVAPEHEAERAARAADTVATAAEARGAGGDLSSELAPGGDELLMEGDGPDAESGEEHEFDLPSGPLMAPTGAEEGSRGDEERVMRAEIPGQRDRERSERGRHRRERGGRGRDRGGREGRPENGAQRDARPDRGGGPQAGREADRGDRPGQQPGGGRPQHDQPRGDQPREGGGPRGIIDAVLDILRSSDGRPMHVRALADQAINRKLLNASGGHVEVVRQLRAALVHEARDREADGLRARVRALGGGHYGLADRKLDQELVPLERDLGDRSARLRDATRTAVRRRIQRLSPPAFEALGRILLEKLGLTAVELVRRGEGVAYYGGTKRLGVASVRTLVAMRPGDVEISRRAVGELRAGLQAKGFDEGLLLAAARPSQEALAELKAGKGVVVHDGLSLAGMCLKHSLGVRRVHMPIDYLDLEFFQELTDA